MHLSMFLTKPERRAKVLVYTKVPDGWDASEWLGDTLEDAAAEANMELGLMNDAYERLADLGVEEVTLTSYTSAGNDTDDPAEAKLWQAFFRHPQNSGMSSCGKGSSAGKALEDCVRIETERQRRNLSASIEYHERAAARLRKQLDGAAS